MNDLELLRDYATQRSEEAFATVVNRYINLVYSAAHRQVGDAHLAEEITQGVFIILSKKASSLREGVILSGWLLRTTRYTAANALRRERSRQHYEQKAMLTNAYESESDQAWTRIGPALDEALARLSTGERDAVALRFFEQKSFREIATVLGITDANAQKRVSRAMEKLRSILGRRGIVAPATTMAAAIAVHSVQAVPAGLAVRVAATVSKGIVSTSAVGLLVESTLNLWKWTRLKAVLGGAAAVALLLITGGVIANRNDPPPTAAAPSPIKPLVVTATPSSSPAVAKLSQPGRNGPSLLLKVLDTESGLPVANARLTLSEITQFPSRSTNYFETDVNGTATLPQPVAEVLHWSYRIELFHDGYVPKYVSWSETLGDAFAEFPSEYATKLDRGVKIGGTVVNEANQPIGAAKVVFSVTGPAPGSARTRERLTMMGNYHQELTDEQGVWKCDHVPKEFGMISYRLLHRKYQDVTYYCDSPNAAASRGVSRLPQKDLLSGTARMEMKRGLVVAGAVVDPEGKPIYRAKITQDHDWLKEEGSLWTDEQGRFRFQNARPKELILTVQVDGFAPLEKTLTPEQNVEDLRFELAKGALLLGRVLDEAGNPIPTARISFGSDAFNRYRLEWRTSSDHDGRFTWHSAPGNSENYAVSAEGFEPLSKIFLVADGTEKTVTLRKQSGQDAPVNLAGTVVDSETKEPIRNFRIFLEATDRAERPGGGYDESTTRTELSGGVEPGKFKLQLSGKTSRFALEVLADGYLPVSLTNDLHAAALNLNFALRPASALNGIVQSPEGKPVEGALVVLCTARDRARMEAPAQFKLSAHDFSTRTETDSSGRFDLPWRTGLKKIVIGAKAGYAEVSPEELIASPKVILQPWGRIEGVFKIGQRIGTNETIWLSNMNWVWDRRPPVQLFLDTKTDAEGRFVLEGVPPGEHKIAWRPGFRDGKIGEIPVSHGMPVVVKPGETTRITLGGSGRAVIGRATFAGDRKVDWLQDVNTLTLKKPNEPIRPSRENFASAEDFSKALMSFEKVNHQFWISDAGMDALRKARTYVVIFKPDCSFRIDDVPAGNYYLRLGLTDPIEDSRFSPGLERAYYARVETEIVIPEVQDPNDQTPFDLGTFELKPVVQSSLQSASR